MPENPFLVPVFVTSLFLLVWAVYRFCRGVEHRKIRQEHDSERLMRARFDSDHLDDYGRGKLNGEEVLRRAKWDVLHGPLMNPLELQNRLENRWPFGSAVQAATGIFTGLLIGLLIWGSGNHNRNGQTVTSSDFPTIANTPVGTTSPDQTFYFVMLTVGACVAAGIALLLLWPSIWGKILGSILLAAAPLVSGKFVLVENMKVVDKVDISLQQKTRSADAPEQPPAGPSQRAPSFRFALSLPSFPQGTANPDEQLRCVIDTLGRDLANDPELSSIVIVGRADKRELRPAVRRQYASNWGLAQQRGACVQQKLLKSGVDASKVLATTAGPLHTNQLSSRDLLAQDRSVSLLITGTGEKHEWTTGLVQGVAYSKCDRDALLAHNGCGSL
jgi:outer membrane protein OmpA-like peptidoglycan-associated protein